MFVTWSWWAVEVAFEVVAAVEEFADILTDVVVDGEFPAWMVSDE